MREQYDALPPPAKAMVDYRYGGDQDSNPYDKETQRTQWEAYAWRMHELWHNDFKAEQDALYHTPKQENGNDKRSSESNSSKSGTHSQPF